MASAPLYLLQETVILRVEGQYGPDYGRRQHDEMDFSTDHGKNLEKKAEDLTPDRPNVSRAGNTTTSSLVRKRRTTGRWNASVLCWGDASAPEAKGLFCSRGHEDEPMCKNVPVDPPQR